MAQCDSTDTRAHAAAAESLGYDHFVVSELKELLRQEDARQVALEKKAALAATLALFVSAYCFDAARGDGTVQGFTAAVGFWTLYCIVSLLCSAYCAIRVSKSPTVKARQLLGDAERGQQPSLRVQGYASHLGLALEEVRNFGEAKASHVDRAQQWAILGSISSLAFLLLHLIFSPNTNS